VAVVLAFPASALAGLTGQVFALPDGTYIIDGSFEDAKIECLDPDGPGPLEAIVVINGTPVRKVAGAQTFDPAAPNPTVAGPHLPCDEWSGGRFLGTSGNDTFELIGNLPSPTFQLLIQGGAGNDIIDLHDITSPPPPPGVQLVRRIEGGPGDDVAVGTAGADTLVGDSGNDTMTGGNGDDFLGGHDGDDVLDGGPGNDTMFGGFSGGTDEPGDDTLTGGLGNDAIDGGAGADVLDSSGASGGVTIDLGTGQASGQGIDTLNGLENVIGSAFDDMIVGGTMPGTLEGRAGNDTVRANLGTLSGGAGRDRLMPLAGSTALPSYLTVLGGAANDVIDFSSVGGAGMTVDAGAGNDTVLGSQGPDQATGGTGKDSLKGFGGVDALSGGAGKDSLAGGAESDFLAGEGGNDALKGESGPDVLFGGPGIDTLNGGGGVDHLVPRPGIDRLVDARGRDFCLRPGQGVPSFVGTFGDANGDGDVDAADFIAWQDQFASRFVKCD
jgi:Ca2+-binding RTX toxin-like protein